jgi:hypothetical protein
VAVQTLPARPQRLRPITRPVIRSIQRSGAPKPRRENATPAKLQEVEDRLIAGALAAHPGRERGVSHLLSDLEKPGAIAASVARLTQLPHAAQIDRIEDLLLEAIIHTHPNRGRAIDRLLGDVVGDAAIDDSDAFAQQAAADMDFDNDFDGLG